MQTGNRYGPVCTDHLEASTTCPVLSALHRDKLAGTQNPGFQLKIEAPIDYPIDEIFVMGNFSLPVAPADISFLPDFVVLSDIQNLASSNMVIMDNIAL